MHIDFTFAPWGMAFAAFMYVVGNGIWMTPLARRNAWLGWLMWTISAIAILVLGAAVEIRLGGGDGIWDQLSKVNIENHWIVVTLYALISVPASACVLFRQETGWTRLAVCAAALLVFIPLGAQLSDPDNGRMALSLGITIAVAGLMWFWSLLFDIEPEHLRKTVPVEEMDA